MSRAPARTRAAPATSRAAPATDRAAPATSRVAPATDRAAWKGPTRSRVRAVRDRLRLVYGIPHMAPHGDPLAELVLTVLSQSTNDRNRDVAYLRLRERFPDWEAVRQAPVAEVEEAIRPGGISKVKSARIKAILDAIASSDEGRPRRADLSRDGRSQHEGLSRDGRSREGLSPDGESRHGDLSLDWMRERSVKAARDHLTSLPGVGRKTAACVLLFTWGLRDVPVDTHVSRVGMRLRLLRPGAGFEELHDEMLSISAPGEELELHVNLLRHGRRTCHARAPACGRCALARMCPSRGVEG